MRRAIVVQARMGSSRLPGKVLLPVAGRPLLQRMLERLRAARVDAELCVATTTNAEDDAIAALCHTISVDCFRGHPTDLLHRHTLAARRVGADVVAKIPSDCPLIDPAVVETVFRAFDSRPGAFDFVTNLNPPSWPDGNDVEIMTRDALEAAFREATHSLEREHTTPFIWQRPRRFRIRNVYWESGRNYSASHRLTIDYPEDYELIRRIFEALFRADEPVFGLGEILELLAARPQLLALNARWAGSSWQRKHAAELALLARHGNATGMDACEIQ